MRCPFCESEKDRVLESRSSEGGAAIRRRRECLGCGARFTSYERIEEKRLMVVKRDGGREPFDRQKVLTGILKATEKRPIPVKTIENLVDEIEERLYREGGREVLSSSIGELIMERLQELDQVAYVRFASVYRQFKDISDFVQEIQTLKS